MIDDPVIDTPSSLGANDVMPKMRKMRKFAPTRKPVCVGNPSPVSSP